MMKIPQYVTVDDVKQVCRDLKISDWTKKKEAKVSVKETKLILKELNPKGIKMKSKVILIVRKF